MNTLLPFLQPIYDFLQSNVKTVFVENLTHKENVFIYGIWLATCFFIAVSLFMSFLILVSRYYKTYIEKRNKRWIKRFELLFTVYLFGDDNIKQQEKVVNHFKKHYLTKPAIRKVLMEELLRFHKDMAGSINDKLKELYILCGLREDSYKKLNSKYVYIKARGIQELRQMEIKEALPHIRKYANHKNLLIRSQVQLSLIRLADKENFSFFDEIEQVIPEWQMLNLVEMLHTLDKESIPDFCQWITSSNQSVVLFSLRMIKQFGQAESSPNLLPLLHHPNSSIRIETINVLTELQFLDITDLLQEMYQREEKEVQISIINALQQLGNDETGLFLQKQFCATNDYDINMALSRACNYLLENYQPEENSNLGYSLFPYAAHVKENSY